MKFPVIIYQEEDGMFIAECPSISGCVSQGETRLEAERNIRNTIKECLQVRAEKGLPLTIDIEEVEVPVSIPNHPQPYPLNFELARRFRLTPDSAA